MSAPGWSRFLGQSVWLIIFTWPALWSVVGLGASWQWFLSSLILAGLFAFIGFRGRLRHWLPRTSLSVLGFIVIVLNWLLAVSFYTQGKGFNDQLFFHITPSSLGVAWGTNRLQMITQFAALASVPLLIWWFSRPLDWREPNVSRENGVNREQPSVPLINSAVVSALLLIAVALSYPALDLAGYLAERAAYSSAPRVASTSYAAIEGSMPKNIILILCRVS